MKHLVTTACLIVGLLKPLPSRSVHAIYISVVEIQHQARNSIVSVKIKVFANDLEDAIQNAYNKRLSIQGIKAGDETSQYVNRYLSNHMELAVGGNELVLELVDAEPMGDAVWLSFRGTCPIEWNELRVFSDFLTELFPTQSNVFSIHHAGSQHFFKLTSGRKTEIIKF